MRDKIASLWYFLIINIIINFVVVLFPKAKVINIPKQIEIKKQIIQVQKVEVNELLKDTSFTFQINGKRKKVEEINQSNFKNNRLGEYYILYKTKIGTYREVDTYHQIKVVDTKKPDIILENGEEIEVELNSTYKDPGYKAIDNYDGDITKKVKVTNKINTKIEGTYIVKYEVEDSSSNKEVVRRRVMVKKDAKEVLKKEENIDYSSYSNIAFKMDFYKKGIKIEGHVKKETDTYELKIGKKTFKLTKKNNFYKGKIDLTKVKDGTYFIKIKGEKEENLFCKIDPKDRLERAHIKNKLITFSYTEKGDVKIKIEPFSYKYDILIDPGHGGEDTGAVINGYVEKNINLEQSLYEKKRYEEHGLKVKLIRDDDTYGEMRGNKDWHIVTRRGFAVGYFASVSKIAYSNHHNSIANNYFMGWEILVPASLTYEELKEEHQIINRWNEIYKLKENHIRMYARDYEDGTIYNKINGQIYHMKNYYAVNRIPYKSYFAKVPIYEGAFMSNKEDFDWYYKNYKKLSEVKIKTYVESLGVKYQKPKEEV